MKLNTKFKKGEFITQNSCPDSFAIFGGEAYDPIEKGAGPDYSLICYYNPSHFNQDSNNRWVREEVFEYDLETNEIDESCEYTINADDMDYWRHCTQDEIENALKILANKRLAWIKETNKFRRLATNEQIKFDTPVTPVSTGEPGGNTFSRQSPIYNRNVGFYNPNASSKNDARKLITRTVKDDWEQKEPITTMTNEHKDLVEKECINLKYAFYNSSVRTFYTGGEHHSSQFNNPNYPDGISAYKELMYGEDWGYFDA